MGLVTKVGRRRPRARLAMGLLYAALVLGAVTTIYPFLLMVTAGLKGPTDQNDNKLIPVYWYNLTGKDETGKPDEGSLWWKFLVDRYKGDISAIASHRIGGEASPETIAKYEQFLMDLPLDFWTAAYQTGPNQITSKLTQRYQAWLRTKYKTIDELNRAYIEENVAMQTVVPPVEQLERAAWSPMPGRKNEEWREFKASLPADFRMPIRAEALYQDFLRSRHQNQFSEVPPEVRGTATRFEELRLPESGPLLEEFRAQRLPARFREETVEERWAKIDPGPLPIDAYERHILATQTAQIRNEFATRNYRYVIDFMALNGRALLNTAIFCALAIITQLTVNPLAAYAISRYPIKASAKILIFLLATMAFPAEVAMIPSFLLLKDLGLLNTFAALVLPTAASGYMIFLLKGFFDSLPQELFEAGQLDGAKEVTMMTRIALPLSKPVLGYLALTAFMGAYGAFMYAFLVCQDQRIWTLMVWIYQLQLVAPRSVVMAALTLAAIPTLIVFLSAQRVIMRGIVLPGER